MAQDGDGNKIKIGDVVFFKCDIEQYGTVRNIRRNSFGQMEVVLEALNDSGFDGDYIGGSQFHSTTPEDVYVED